MKRGLSLLYLLVFLFSCEKSACDCKKDREEIAIGMQQAIKTFDYSTMKDLQEEREDREEKCSKFTKDDYKKCPFSEVLGE